MTMRRTPRLDAEKAKKITYIGFHPCPHCGGELRYVVNGGCVVCVKAVATVWLRAKRGFQRRLPSHPEVEEMAGSP